MDFKLEVDMNIQTARDIIKKKRKKLISSLIKKINETIESRSKKYSYINSEIDLSYISGFKDYVHYREKGINYSEHIGRLFCDEMNENYIHKELRSALMDYYLTRGWRVRISLENNMWTIILSDPQKIYV